MTILRAAAGAVTPSTKLTTLFQCNPDFGKLEWMIAVLAIEIELGVEIPESIADDHRQTVSRFAARVTALPRIDSPEYTLDRLSLLAQALLSSEEGSSPSRRR
jgi:hypothetical protein